MQKVTWHWVDNLASYLVNGKWQVGSRFGF